MHMGENISVNARVAGLGEICVKNFSCMVFINLKLIYKPISFSLDSPDSSEVASAGTRALSTEDRTCTLLVFVV